MADRFGRGRFEATPAVRAMYGPPSDVGGAVTMDQVKRVERDDAPGQLDAALRMDAAKPVLDLGQRFAPDCGRAAR